MIDALGVQVPPPRELALVRAGEAAAELRHVKEQIEIQWQALLQTARSFSWSRGLVFADTHTGPRLIPIALLPTPVKKACFDQAKKLGPLFAELALRSVLNLEWMKKSLAHSRSDMLTAKLLGIAERVYGQGARDVTQDLHVGILRNDYMIGKQNGELTLKQIELNTISAAFPGHATVLYEFHRLAIETSTGQPAPSKKLPENFAVHNIGKLIADAVTAYRNKYKVDTPLTPVTPSEQFSTLCTPLPIPHGHCIIFVVVPDEPNVCDHYLVEEAVHRHRDSSDAPIPVYRYTLDELVKLMQTKDKDMLASLVLGASPGTKARPLLMRDPIRRSVFREVACVYFRAAYAAEHYTTDAAWDVRELIETSDSVSIPSVPLQLAGSKKLQTLWADAQTLETLIPDASSRAAMQAVFEDAVDPAQPDATPNGRKLLQEAVEHPERFILKTLCEGGSPQFSDALKRIAEAGLKGTVEHEAATLGLPTSSFVLMRKIDPEAHVAVVHPAVKSSNSNWLSVDVNYSLSELGTFDGFISDGLNVLRIEHLGHLLRTKRASEVMGGVCIGAACLDSPWLAD